ncbi:TonB-dependent receptor [Sphingobium sp. AP49]|uniref:TonB-dependent receptor n=1 Tax=Sphingobium sp. AP49 TaxID=1144307 RepID=UPI00026ED32E|nr:TonB-dependent receptor [Sphingobium sp. AP49]WHO39243.1 TonB-dependent receptor [Sphingobium sp. AP49]
MIEHYSRIASARRSSVIALAVAMMAGAPAYAQEQAPQAQPDQETADIVVTGFRASLNNALSMKRKEAAAVDSIVAEDIGKFPDSNLAESMQRVPGVALARGDGGEGRNISVRGLGAAFTRVRINGMEGSAQTGSSDIYGGGNNGRSFDFNVFSTEIFSALSVRKTPSADVEEGSLGATVDLTAPKPLDQKEDFVLAATARGVYNELSKKFDPRASLLVGKKFDDGRFGVLASLAYQKRNIREVGYSAVDILSANTNGGFCSPLGFAPQNPANNVLKGTDAANCSTGNPRTSNADAYQTVFDARRDDMPNAAGSGAFFPRIPRYLNSTQKQERIGGTLSLQFQPDDDTDISVDTLYSRFHVVRNDNYIEAISFGRSASNNGQPMTSIKDVDLTPEGGLVYGLFDGVDVRSEGLRDDFVTTFKQANLNFKHRFTDNFEVTGLFGMNDSKWTERQRLQYFMDAIDTDNFSIDYRDGGSTPLLGFGFDVSDPTNFNFAPGRADGTVLGGFSLQGKPSTNRTKGTTAELNFAWTVSPALTLKAGAQYRQSDFTLKTTNYYTADTIVKGLPAGTSLASLTRQISGVDKLWGRGAPDSWASIDPQKLYDALDLDASRPCYVECGAVSNRVREDVVSAYVMGNFDLSDAVGFGLRGDAGVRYVSTDQFSSGYNAIPLASSPTGITGAFLGVTNKYEDWLPSANVVIEPIDNLLFRFSAAKTLARAELASLTPTRSVNATTRNGSIGNANLSPIRANTFDAAVEWYFRPGALLSAAFFYKDIKSYIQNVTTLIPFNQLGLPDALLIGTNTQPDELFSVSQPTNTPGGPLKGIELNAQIPFDFLGGGFISHFGALANYTHVTSKIDYCLTSAGGVCTTTTTNDLIGLSKNTASGTLYYEDSKFSIRSTVNWRDGFIRGIPASPGSDLLGNDPTLFVDASASYNINDRFKIIVEATNLTDEQNRLYVDSVRKDTLFETRIGRTFTVGVNYRM